MCDFKIKKIKGTRRKLAPGRKIWKLLEDSFENSDFRSYNIKYRVKNKMLLLKVIGTFLKQLCERLQIEVIDRKKAQADIKKRFSGVTLVLV